MFYIFLPCFIYLCQFHVASLFIYAAPRFQSLLYYFPSFMLHQHKNFVASRFVSSSIFSTTPYREKISSPALFCAPIYRTGAEITRHNNSNWCVNQLSIFLHIVTWDYVAQSSVDCVWLEIWRSWVQSPVVYWLSVRTRFVRPGIYPNAACP